MTKDNGRPKPASYTEMRDMAISEVWQEFGLMKGVAKMQALKQIVELARAEPDGGGEPEPEPTAAEVIGGIVQLPRSSKLKICARELLELDRERDALVALCESLGVSETDLRAVAAEASGVAGPDRGYAWNLAFQTALAAGGFDGGD